MSNQDYLQHYGVLGMKWGVRNEEKPSGSNHKGTRLSTGTKIAAGITAVSAATAAVIGAKYLKAFKLGTVVKAGKTIQNIGTRKSGINTAEKFYGAVNRGDKRIYEGLYGCQLRLGLYEEEAQVFKQNLKAAKDIKVASIDRSRKEFVKLYNENDDVKKYVNSMLHITSGTPSKKDFNKMHDRVLTIGPLYSARISDERKVFDSLQSNLKSNGFGGVIDINDVKGTYRSTSPVVFFDGIQDSLVTDSIKEMSADELINKFKREKGLNIARQMAYAPSSGAGAVAAESGALTAFLYNKDKKRGEKKNAKQR